MALPPTFFWGDVFGEDVAGADEGGKEVAGEGGVEVCRDLDDGAEAFIGDAGAPGGGRLDEANLVVGGEVRRRGRDPARPRCG